MTLSKPTIRTNFVDKRATIELTNLNPTSISNVRLQNIGKTVEINDFRTAIFAFNVKSYYFKPGDSKENFADDEQEQWVNAILSERAKVEAMRVESNRELVVLATNAYVPKKLIDEVIRVKPDKSVEEGLFFAINGIVQGANGDESAIRGYIAEDKVMINTFYPELSSISETVVGVGAVNPNTFFAAVYSLRQRGALTGGMDLPRTFNYGYMPPKTYKETKISDLLLGVIYSYEDSSKPWLDPNVGYGASQPNEAGNYGVLMHTYDMSYSSDDHSYGEFAAQTMKISDMLFDDADAGDINYYKNPLFQDMTYYMPISSSFAHDLSVAPTFGLDFAIPNGTQVLVGFIDGNPGLPYIAGFTGLNVFDQRPSRLTKALDAIRDTFDLLEETTGSTNQAFGTAGTVADTRDAVIKHIVSGDRFPDPNIMGMLDDIGWDTSGDGALGFDNNSGMSVAPEYTIASPGGSKVEFTNYRTANTAILSSKETSISETNKVSDSAQKDVLASNTVIYGGGAGSPAYISRYTPMPYQQIALKGFRENIFDYTSTISSGDQGDHSSFWGYRDVLAYNFIESHYQFSNDPMGRLFAINSFKMHYLLKQYPNLTSGMNMKQVSLSSPMDYVENLSAKPSFTELNELGGDYLIRRFIGNRYIFRKGNTFNYYVDNDQYLQGQQEHIKFPAHLSSQNSLNKIQLGRSMFTGVTNAYQTQKSYAQKTYMDEYYMVKGNSMRIYNGTLGYNLYGAYMLKNTDNGYYFFGDTKVNFDLMKSKADFKLNTRIMSDQLMFGQRNVFTRGNYTSFQSSHAGIMLDDLIVMCPVITITGGHVLRYKQMGTVIRAMLGPLLIDVTLTAGMTDVYMAGMREVITAFLGFIVGLVSMVIGAALVVASTPVIVACAIANKVASKSGIKNIAPGAAPPIPPAVLP